MIVVCSPDVGTTRPNASTQSPGKTGNGALRKPCYHKLPRALSTSLNHWQRHRFNIQANYPVDQIPSSGYVSHVDNYSSVICRLLDDVSFGTVKRPHTAAAQEVTRRKNLIMSDLEATRATNKERARVGITRVRKHRFTKFHASKPNYFVGFPQMAKFA